MSQIVIPAATADTGPDALVLAGLDVHRAGRLEEAGLFYSRALATAPNHADALNLSGALAFAAGRHDDAVRLIGKAIRAQPGHLDAHLNLAEALEAAGRGVEAVATCHKALVLAPDFAEAHARLARLVAISGAAVLALAHARVALDPDSVEALCGQGIAFAALRRFTEADAAYRRALDLAPDDMRALTGRAAILRDTDRVDEARALYQQAVNLRPGDPALMASLGGLIELDGDITAARDMFEAAMALDPRSAEIRFAYGRCLRDTGAFDAAATQFLEVISQHPKYVPALLALVRMKRLPDSSGQRKQLIRLTTETALPVRHRVQAGFALGEVLDRAGEFDAAFSRFSAANALHGQHRAATGERFDRADLLSQIGAIDRHLARDYASDTLGWGNPAELPVFIVGLPRSGTTLVEQICASHSQVAGLGELRAIQRIARDIAGHNQGARAARRLGSRLRACRGRPARCRAGGKRAGGGPRGRQDPA